MIVSSFDIFDTCITRSCGSGENVLFLLAKSVVRDVDESLAREFVRCRKQAEQDAITESGKEAVTLDEVYDVFDTSLFSDKSKEEIKKKEIDIEISSFVPVKKILALIEECRKKGRVIFISDMYLTADVLRSALISLGIMKNDERIFVSGNIGLTKCSGNLFDYVKEKEKLARCKWTHYGDDRHNDYDMPRKKGIKAELIHTNYSIYEKKWQRESGIIDNQALSVFAGVLRSVRLNRFRSDKDEFVTNLMAPLFVSFTLLLLKRAKENGIKRLFFAARDMYIPFQIAQMYSSVYPEMELKYLHISTKALYPSYIEKGTEDELRFVMGLVEYFKPVSMLKVFGFSEDEIKEIGLAVDLKNAVSVKNGTADLLISEMLKGERRTVLLERCKEKKKMLLAYLSQEGLLSCIDKVAIADLGWRCSSQCVLKKIISTDCTFFYYGVSSNRLDYNDMGKIDPLSFGESVGSSLYYQFVIEYYMCRSTEGTTLGYIYAPNGRIEPLLGSEEIIDKNGILKNIDVVLHIAKLIHQYDILTMGQESLMYNRAVFEVKDFSDFPQSHMIKSIAPYLYFEHFTSPKPCVYKLSIGDFGYLALRKVLRKLHIRIPQKVKMEWINGTIVYSLGSFGDWIIRLKKIL